LIGRGLETGTYYSGWWWEIVTKELLYGICRKRKKDKGIED
jgi:hypothetical protein